MGLEIGFSIYKKEKDNEGKLFLKKVDFPKEKEDDSWSCGRCEVNYSWGYGCKEETGEITRVTFDKELDNYVIPQTKEEKEHGYYPVILHYIPYEEYKGKVKEAIDNVNKEILEAKHSFFSKILANKKAITELRELQKSCGADNEFAFDKWTKEIKELRQDNLYLQSNIDRYEEEDYDASHAKRLEKLLQYLEECQKEGYVCIPWYSC